MKKWTKHKKETRLLISNSYKRQIANRWKKKSKTIIRAIEICNYYICLCIQYKSLERRNKQWLANTHNDVIDEEIDCLSTDDITLTDFLSYINSLH